MSRRNPYSHLLSEWQAQLKNLRHIEAYFANASDGRSCREAELYASAAIHTLERCIKELMEVRYAWPPSEPSPAADAVDPSADSTGKPPTRDV